MSNENNPNFENLLKSVSDKLGKSPEELKKASETGNIENLLGNLRPNDAQKIQKILSDKNAANKILSTPQAQSLIKKLLGDK
ncbi:uncharacterized protein BN706_00818 [Clostridium sp. CAG:557]|jgi:hypothetical protein|nr:uncharacterized protein BN706_00818 [Clostridium sp. CAG:557]